MDGISAIQLVNSDEPICIIVSLIFRETINFPDFITQFKDHVIRGMFTERIVVRDWLWSYYEKVDSSDWDLMSNVKRFPGVSTQIDFDSLLDHLAQGPPIDLSKPAWELYFFDSLSSCSSTAVVFRFHHVYADGFNAVQHFIGAMRPLDISEEISNLLPRANSAKNKSRHLFSRFSFSMVYLCMHAILRLLCIRSRPCKIRANSCEGRVVASETLSFSVEELKKCGNFFNCSINDILVSAFAGSLERVLKPHYETTQEKELLTIVWAGKRNLEISRGCSNLGLFYLDLPVSHWDERKRLSQVKDRMKSLKKSLEGETSNFLLKFLGIFPRNFLNFFFEFLTDKASISISNLPGFTKPVIFPTSPFAMASEVEPGSGVIEKASFFVPPVMNIGIFLSILSYNGKIQVSICASKKVMNKKQAKNLIDLHMNEILKDFLT